MRQSEIAVAGILESEEPIRQFAREAGRGLAEFVAEDLSEGRLCLVFALSAWLRRAGATIAAGSCGLLRLRDCLLEVSSLDTPSEPVPLMAGGGATALLALATYTHGLIGRSASSRHSSARSIVEEALDRLQ